MTHAHLVQKRYGTNELILSSAITFENYSRPWIMKQLQALCEERKIIRYEKGVYYIPTKTVFGDSILNPRKVIEKSILKMAIRLLATTLE